MTENGMVNKKKMMKKEKEIEIRVFVLNANSFESLCLLVLMRKWEANIHDNRNSLTRWNENKKKAKGKKRQQRQ